MSVPPRHEEALARRTEVEKFIKDTLKPGVDFGIVHRKIGPRDNPSPCPNLYTPDTWQGCDKCHQSPSLWQPGAERICEAFGVYIAEPVLATDVMTAFGGAGWVAFRVTLHDRRTKEVLGHGIGANKNLDPNVTVKKAAKSALIDGVRKTFALSGFFEDENAGGGGDEEESRAAKRTVGPVNPAGPVGPKAPAATATASAPTAPAQAPAAAPAATKKAPEWWKVGLEFPSTLWEVRDRDGATVNAMGCLHFLPDELPLVGPDGRKWSPFTPNADGKPEFKTKEPFPSWAKMTWRELVEYARAHRVQRPGGAMETTQWNDPFYYLLHDTYVAAFRGAPTPLAEQAVALDCITWNLVCMDQGKAVPKVETRMGKAAQAAAPAAAAPPAPAAPPAAAPTKPIEEEVPF